MRKLNVFTVMSCTPGMVRDTAKIEAHYMTGPAHPRDRVRFWVKPHWYSWARCVGLVDWSFVVAIRNDVSTNADWVKDAGVQL